MASIKHTPFTSVLPPAMVAPMHQPSQPSSLAPRSNSLGLGCVTFGREIDRAAAFAMMDFAVEHSIAFFDTAAAYGAGASETIVGAWLASRAARARVMLATKLLPPYAPIAIAAAVAASLGRLAVASIDVLFLHRWDKSVVEAATLRAFDELVRDGRVRELGASNFSAAQLECVLNLQARLGVAKFRALQNIHNLAVREIDAPTRGLCARAGVALVAYSPLGAGFLTGKHERAVEPGSRFDLVPGHQKIYFTDLARLRLARLKSVADRSGVPMTRLALAWALHQPQIATVLVGGRTPAHLKQALQAQTFDSPELLRELDSD